MSIKKKENPLRDGTKHPSNVAIINYISENTGIPIRDSRDVIRTMFHFIARELAAGRQVNIHSFGRFHTKVRKGRTVTFKNHPVMGDRTLIHRERKYIKFKISKVLSDLINPEQEPKNKPA